TAATAAPGATAGPVPAPPAAGTMAGPADAPPSASAGGAASSTAVPSAAVPAAALDEVAFSKAYASPSVRKFARELGADLGRIKGTGPKERITQDDVKAYVKKLLTTPAAAASALPRVP